MSTGRTGGGRATSILLTIRGSFLAFVTTIGVGCCLLALVLSEYVIAGLTNGVLAAMFAVWSASAFVYAVLGHLGLRLIGYR